MSKIRLHRLIFLSNCLAPVYGEKPLDEQVIKYKWGPFYPDAQWDVDRMAIQGLLALTEANLIKDRRHGWWLHANYELLEKGRELSEDVIDVLSLQRVFEFLVELTNGYASLDEAVLDDVALKDANYNAPAVADWAPINFSEVEDNYSALAATTFRELLPKQVAPDAREQVQLYLRYLGRIARTELSQS